MTVENISDKIMTKERRIRVEILQRKDLILFATRLKKYHFSNNVEIQNNLNDIKYKLYCDFSDLIENRWVSNFDRSLASEAVAMAFYNHLDEYDETNYFLRNIAEYITELRTERERESKLKTNYTRRFLSA